jgi:hypothetical protein
VRKAPAAYDDGVYMMSGKNRYLHTEVEFWDIIGTKVFRVFLLAIHSHLHSPFSKSDLKLVCNVNIVYGNVKSENSPFMTRNLNEIVCS